MLEDAGRRLGELADQSQRTVEIEQVVVGELLAVPQLRGRQVGPAGRRLDIERGLLVGVFAVPQRLPQTETQVKPIGKSARIVGRRAHDPAKVIGDGLIVRTGCAEGRQGEPASILQGGPALVSDAAIKAAYCSGLVKTAT